MFFTRQEALARHDGNTRTRARDDMDMERLLKVFVVTKHLVIWYDIGIIVILAWCISCQNIHIIHSVCDFNFDYEHRKAHSKHGTS